MKASENFLIFLSQERRDVYTRISRIYLIWIGLLVVVVVTLLNSFRTLESDDFKAKLSELQTAAISIGMPAHPITDYDYLVDDPFKGIDFSTLRKPINEMTEEELKKWNTNHDKWQKANTDTWASNVHSRFVD